MSALEHIFLMCTLGYATENPRSENLSDLGQILYRSHYLGFIFIIVVYVSLLKYYYYIIYYDKQVEWWYFYIEFLWYKTILNNTQIPQNYHFMENQSW